MPLLAGAVLLSAPCAAQTPPETPAPTGQNPPRNTGPAGPTSILPDIFDDVAEPPPNQPRAMPETVLPPGDPFAGAAAAPGGEPPTDGEELAEIPPEDPLANLVGPVTLPESAGILDQYSGGLGADLFAGSDGRYLGTLLRRIDAPLASRWLQIQLSRALLTRATPPSGVNPGDWLAARGEALIAMGSAADAHRMIAPVLPDRYTEGLYAVAASAAIAAGDPLALCPFSRTARSFIENPFWELADAMCGSIEGDEFGAARLFDRLRRSGAIAGFDVGLAERLSSAVGGGRRGANPEWSAVDRLTPWRLGAASAAGLAIPEPLLAAATPQQAGWLVRLAGQGIAQRAAAMPLAAGIGALSSSEANRLIAAEALTLDPSAMGSSPGGQARAAQAGRDDEIRLEALRGLMTRDAEGSIARHGWTVAAALSAAWIRPAASALADGPAVVGALLSAGLVREARAWWTAADGADDGTRAAIWAPMVAADRATPMDNGLFRAWAGTVSPHRAALLAAGLRGLGRGEPGDPAPVIENEWTASLSAAAAARRRGDVLVIAATGMQLGWANVPPDYLRRIAAAMRAVGLESEAGLIVAEGATRG